MERRAKKDRPGDHDSLRARAGQSLSTVPSCEMRYIPAVCEQAHSQYGARRERLRLHAAEDSHAHPNAGAS